MERSVYRQSAAYHEDASRVIAGGVNSNVRLVGEPPLCFIHARGPRLTDLDGNCYIDYALGMGPAILGHAPRVVTEAVAKSLENGQVYAGQSTLERDLAERLGRYIPGAELVRIGVTGSEMVQAALRVARATTGKCRFIKFSGHYHGWFDNVLSHACTFNSAAQDSPGIAEPLTLGQSAASLTETTILPWNDIATLTAYLEKYGTDVAALIMEPVMCNTGVISPNPGYLNSVRQLCDRYGVVLIFDEVITGFRVGLGGAQQMFGMTADLCIFAKALGGGVPISALTGRRSIMAQIATGAVNHSGTYNSNVISLAAAIATLDSLAADDCGAYARINAAGTALIEGMRGVARALGDNLAVQGYPSVFHTTFGGPKRITSLEEYNQCDRTRQQRFMKALLERGVRPTARGTWFVSAAHTETEVEATLAAVRYSLKASA